MSELAHRYAEALYGLTTGEAALRETAAALQSVPEVWEALTSPAVTPAEKRAVLSRLPGLSAPPEILNFLGLLSDKGRMALLPEIVEAFHALGLEARNAAPCVLTCVRPPDAEGQRRIRELLCKLHHRSEVVMTIRTDPALLGGFTLDIDGVTYDKSVRGGLRQLSRRLEEGNAT